MFNITSFINPNLAIDMLKRGIEKQLKEEITDFSIIHKSNDPVLKFIIPLNIKYKNRTITEFYYKSQQIMSIINNQVKKELSKNQILDFITFDVKNGKYDIKVFYTELNEKKFFKLNK
jgi:hypothetical protein